MDLMEHVRRPMVDDVQLQVVGSQNEQVVGGTMCVTPFHLIFSSRKKAEDELTVNSTPQHTLLMCSYIFLSLADSTYIHRPYRAQSIDHKCSSVPQGFPSIFL